uniref:autotransporter outer membrane beta-barrel domain-containing protein n=1 Tax=Escherichia albertii TaxID=208962 RepID=UPI0039BF6D19
TGAETLNGIEVIHVSGNADNAEFIQTERITAGAYDYILKRGQGINSTNWYLISRKDIPVPQSEAVPETLSISCEVTFRHGTLRFNGNVSEKLLTLLIQELKR